MVNRYAQTKPEEAALEIIQSLAGANLEKNVKLDAIQGKICKKYKIPLYPIDKLLQAYHELVKNGTLQPNKKIEQILRLKPTRSLSGIVSVSILTKPYPCPGKCIYCPAVANMPRSYLNNEPAVMRAVMFMYDPYKQTAARLQALKNTGHPIDKICIRVVGGTWSYYPKYYQTWFIKRTFQACNEFGRSQKSEIRSQILEDAQKQNETADHRVVELSIETRQDYIDEKEIIRLRRLGVTKVEIGVQSLYDDVLDLNKRGHKTDSTTRATKLLKDAGFKVSYQMMLNLYGSDLNRDLAMFGQLFDDPDFKPDHLKIYPLAVVKQSAMYRIYQQGLFKPYDLEELTNLLVKIKQEIPFYCRVERIIRDIPTESIVEGGVKVSNLRQIVQERMSVQGIFCKCIRCREARSSIMDNSKVKMFRHDYTASDGKEIFLSFETNDRSKLLSMIRLRIPSYHLKKQKHFISILNNSLLIREIHTYGQQIPIGKREIGATQHFGFGDKLLAEAEKIAISEGLLKIVAISGVGVRKYFKSRGYELLDTYMTKSLCDNCDFGLE